MLATSISCLPVLPHYGCSRSPSKCGRVFQAEDKATAWSIAISRTGRWDRAGEKKEEEKEEEEEEEKGEEEEEEKEEDEEEE